LANCHSEERSDEESRFGKVRDSSLTLRMTGGKGRNYLVAIS